MIEPVFPGTKRPPIHADVARAVYARYGNACYYCGSTEKIELDHICAFVNGGETDLDNLVPACQVDNLLCSDRFYPGGLSQKKDWVLRCRTALGPKTLAALSDAIERKDDVTQARILREGIHYG